MNDILNDILLFLEKEQKVNGEFQALEYYPVFSPEKGWFYAAPSPFIHANILLCLLHFPQSDLQNEILSKGINFLQQTKEFSGLWRYWPLDSGHIKVPLDIDDTALCSYLIEFFEKKELPNKKWLARNTDPKGYFKTWLLPQKRFLRFPSLFLFLSKDFFTQTWKIHFSKMLHRSDKEPGVAANVIFYLAGSDEAATCAQLVAEEIKEKGENIPLQFYHDPICVYYHIARAKERGVKAFESLGEEVIIPYLSRRFAAEIENDMLNAMATSTLLIYGVHKNDSLVQKLMDSILLNSKSGNWKHHTYFTSKERIFQAGAATLTAAVCGEAIGRILSDEF